MDLLHKEKKLIQKELQQGLQTHLPQEHNLVQTVLIKDLLIQALKEQKLAQMEPHALVALVVAEVVIVVVQPVQKLVLEGAQVVVKVVVRLIVKK